MSADTSPFKDTSKDIFQEIEVEDFNNALLFKIAPNQRFSTEQVDKIKAISKQGYSGEIDEERFVKCHFVKHVIFTDSDSTYLCLASRQWYHIHMWRHIQDIFGTKIQLLDGGDYGITQEDETHFISSYVSISLSEEGNEITPEECFVCRDEIENMNVGIDILKGEI